jgi:hypothetical protein
MILTAPDDRQFPNGPAFAKGDPVDVAELAAALGVDAAQLGADLLDQGWPEAKASTSSATKADLIALAEAEGIDLAGAKTKAEIAAAIEAAKTSPAPAGDDTTPDKGDDTEES